MRDGKERKTKMKEQTIIVQAVSDERKRCLELANRVLSDMEDAKRIVVRFTGTAGEELYRVITKEYSFQFKATSPEIIEMEDYRHSFESGCIELARDLARSVAGAKDRIEFMENEIRDLKRLGRLKDSSHEQLKTTNKTTQEILNKCHNQMIQREQLVRHELQRLKGKTATTQLRGYRKLLRDETIYG